MDRSLKVNENEQFATRSSALPTLAEQLLREMIAKSGPISWRQAMELALYHPQAGYYGSTVRPVGRKGDFFTSVSVGSLYGELIAEVALKVWDALGKPEDFVIAEQAAHDGQLMADIRAATTHLAFGKNCRFVIVEPQPHYRQAQKHKLGDTIEWLNSPTELAGQGLLVCNELLDAFPVDRIRFEGGKWRELAIDVIEGQLTWVSRDWRDEPALPCDLHDGYTTEWHAAATDWAHAVATSDWKGAVLIADYGHDAEDYYAPERAGGSLRRYINHRSDTDVLIQLGEADLTSHINFTAVKAAFTKASWEVESDLPQGRFLQYASLDWLKRAPTPEKVRQFMTLTHPSHLGAVFRSLLMTQGLTKSGPLFKLHP
ncbi:MAG: SAM-dependent methyltransferase [Verrucomicrobiaceae bacterium]|nr:SAM-dependent methyltransferase [Verrucomicrobiaceae bacterium]